MFSWPSGIQGDIDEETERRKELEHRLHQSEADSEVQASELRFCNSVKDVACSRIAMTADRLLPA